jgi:hypothetical protein
MYTAAFAALILAAPAPSTGRQDQETFTALKGKLPRLVDAWAAGVDWPQPEVRSLRRFGPDEAKVTLVFTSHRPTEPPRVEQIIVLFLKSDGVDWVTTRFESSATTSQTPFTDVKIRELMLLVDESGKR